MKLIVILAAFALERYFNVGAKLARFAWFERYVALLRQWCKAQAAWSGPAGIALVVAPLAIIVGLIYWLVGDGAYGLVGLVISLVILIYCIGPQDWYQRAEHYLKAVSTEGEETVTVEQAVTDLMADETVESEIPPLRQATKSLFIQSLRNLFGVLIWFVILGPIGAVIYRTSLLWQQLTAKTDSEYATYAECALTWIQILDWLPVRVVTLAYCLAGNFGASFAFWIKHVAQGWSKNFEILTESGLIALGVHEAQPTIDENRDAIGLTHRALIIVMVLIAIFTIGMWID
ncbi:MAG: regulatory signaling modulator protein AmpE [Gammaproteobacteria bacterium]